MPSTDYTRDAGDDYVTEQTDTGSQVAQTYGHVPYRHFRVSTDDREVVNDGTDTEVVTVEVVNGLEVARGTAPVDATVLDYDGDVTVRVDGIELTKTLTDGGVSFDVTTEKSAGSVIEVEAADLADHPAESDTAEIEVTE